MTKLGDLKIKIFADGADLEGIRSMYAKPWIKGFTTNPTLMRKVGISDYKSFASEVLREVPDRPVSFEVFADEFNEMEAQALEIASWGSNVNVKIPVTNTKRQFAGPLIRRLSEAGVQINITAVMTLEQVKAITDALAVSTQIGPVVDQRQLDKNLSYIDIGQAEGGLSVFDEGINHAARFLSRQIVGADAREGAAPRPRRTFNYGHRDAASVRIGQRR